MAGTGARAGDDYHRNGGSWLDRLRRRLGRAGIVRLLLWGALLAGALSSTSVAVASAGGGSLGSRRPEVVTAAPRLPHGARAVGAVSATTQVTGLIALRLRDQTGLRRFLASVTNPRSPAFHQYLARGQFAKRFGPTQQELARVEAQLRASGLRVTGASANRILVHFAGSAAHVESAFGTGLERIRLADGSTGRATTSAVRVPAGIAPQVTAVLGLDQLVHYKTNITHRTSLREHGTGSVLRPHTATGGPSACPDAQAANNIGGLTDQQVAKAYGLGGLYSGGDVASGQTVDVYEEEPFSTSDIQKFEQCYFGRSNTGNIQTIAVDGGPGAGTGSGEAALDIENVAAMAPQAKINVYAGPLTGVGGVDLWNAIAVADDARQVTSSWGLCETAMQKGGPGQQQVESEIFQQTAAQGQSVFNAAGDDGSDSCAGQAASPVAANLSVSDPASQPYVTGVGGTTMITPTTPPSESVWNNGATGGAGGGGISESWSMPSWQSASAVGQNPADEACSNDPAGTADDYHLDGYPTTLAPGISCREVPDVSALADPQTGITVYWDGTWGLIGGTSSAAPIWAGILAEINASSACSSGSSPVGFVSPLLYQIAQSGSASYAAAFNDITSGNNDNLGVGDGTTYAAGAGYDMASGLGTPRVTNPSNTGLDQQLCSAASASSSSAGGGPYVQSLSATSGPVSGGGTETITGGNFGTSPGSVYFGTAPATVSSWSPSSISVTIPAYAAPPSTPAGSAGRAIVTVVTSSGQSSSPGAHSIFEYTADSPSGGPVVDYISPPYGSSAGGNTVDIVGAALGGATAVAFGNAPATIDSRNQDELRVTVPPEPSSCQVPASQGMCAVAVTVTTPAGVSSGPAILKAYQGPITFGPDGAFALPAGCACEVTEAPEEYDYADAPVISSVSPSYMDENGTSTAVVSGTNFNLLTYEWTNIGPSGQNSSQDFQLEAITPTSISVGVSPDPNSTVGPDLWDLSVQSALQTSNSYPIEYAGNPVLTSISKHLVSQSAPGSLTISGQGLSDVNSVVFSDQQGLGFGYTQSTAITNQSDTHLTVQIPSFFAIPTDVLACTVTGCSLPTNADTLVFAYPGRPAVASSSPRSGPPGGGTTVLINGSFDSNVTSVRFGKKAATIKAQPVATPSGQISVKAPPGTPRSKVDITITTYGGQLVGHPTSAVTPAATFTYGPARFLLGKPAVSRNGTLTYRLKAPMAGRFTGKGLATLARGAKPSSYGEGAVRSRRAQEVRLVIKPSRAARSALTSGRTLKVRVTVSFRPAAGPGVTHRGTVIVKGRR